MFCGVSRTLVDRAGYDDLRCFIIGDNALDLNSYADFFGF